MTKPGSVVEGSPDFVSEQAYERRILGLSVGFTVIAAFAFVVQNLVGLQAAWMPCAVLLAFCIMLLRAGGGIRDPLFLFGVVLFTYSFLPQFAPPTSHWFLQVFGTNGASTIYSVAIISYIASCGVAVAVLPARARHFVEPTGATLFTMQMAGTIGAVLSILLSLYYISVNGLVIGGDIEYGESFRVKLQVGTGVLLLAVPFAIAALSLLVTARHRLFSWQMLLCFAAFALLYLAHGQRKYLLIPVIILGAWHVRARSWGIIAAWLAAGVAAFAAFSYLGYLRTANIPLVQFADARALQGFAAQLGANLAGAETIILYATAGAAYSGFVQPLPFGGDYTLSWVMALPQFWAGSLFTPLNTRFASLIDPIAAAAGQGFGFSYWGEAYLVGGWAMIPFACLGAILFFRYLFVRGGGRKFLGIGGAIALSSLYFALWLQRNALAYVVREFVVYQIVSIALLLLAARLLCAMLFKVRMPARAPRLAKSQSLG